jgi:hypothetical protein
LNCKTCRNLICIFHWRKKRKFIFYSDVRFQSSFGFLIFHWVVKLCHSVSFLSSFEDGSPQVYVCFWLRDQIQKTISTPPPPLLSFQFLNMISIFFVSLILCHLLTKHELFKIQIIKHVTLKKLHSAHTLQLLTICFPNHNDWITAIIKYAFSIIVSFGTHTVTRFH